MAQTTTQINHHYNHAETEAAAQTVHDDNQVIPSSKDKKGHDGGTEFLYTINEIPPWYICILSGFQHFILTFTCTIPLPGLLADIMCIPTGHPVRSLLLSTIMFGCGLATIVQTTVGIRLPIVQGFTFSFFVATSAILKLPKWKCPKDINETLALENPEYIDDIWQPRMREVQGAIVLSAVVMVVLCLTGVVGLLVRLVTPLTILATNTLIGLSALDSTIEMSSKNWGLAGVSMVVMIIFSQHMSGVHVPYPACGRGGFRVGWYPLFNVFPILLSVGLMWLVCYVLTITDYFPVGNPSRTDASIYIVTDASWFHVPYPCQWGMPTFSVSSTVGMMAGVVAVSFEIIGNYHVCANLIGLPPPPNHAVSRGVLAESIGCIIMGLLGAGNGTTTHSENVGALTLTRMSSRVVVQTAAAIMIILSLITKFSAFFTIIPPPIMGALYVIEFAMVIGVGINNVHSVDMSSSRNLFIIGISLYLGMLLPTIAMNPETFQTGYEVLDQVVEVVLSTGMLIGGLTGCILDNTIPGSKRELAHRVKPIEDALDTSYDLPLFMSYFRRWRWTRYVPICPTFRPSRYHQACCPCCRCRPRRHSLPETITVPPGALCWSSQDDEDFKLHAPPAYAPDVTSNGHAVAANGHVVTSGHQPEHVSRM